MVGIDVTQRKFKTYLCTNCSLQKHITNIMHVLLLLLIAVVAHSFTTVSQIPPNHNAHLPQQVQHQSMASTKTYTNYNLFRSTAVSTLRLSSSLQSLFPSVAAYDLGVTAMVAGESVLWLRLWSTVARRGLLDSKITRKIIHTGSAPLLLAHWPLFSSAPQARYFAALIPLLQMVRYQFCLLYCDIQ